MGQLFDRTEIRQDLRDRVALSPEVGNDSRDAAGRDSLSWKTNSAGPRFLSGLTLGQNRIAGSFRGGAAHFLFRNSRDNH